MTRAATGELRSTPDGLAVRVTLKGRRRETFLLSGCRTREEAEERRGVLAGLARRFRAVGIVESTDAIRTLEAIAASSGPTLKGWLQVAEELAGNELVDVPKPGVMTFKEVCDAWTSGDLAEQYPGIVQEKKSAAGDAWRARFIIDRVGHVPVSAFRLEHAERVMRELPPGQASATRRHYAQIIRRVLELSVYPLRLIPANPIPKGFMPKVKREKAMTYLYPDEDAKLMACQDRQVPLALRVFFGFLAREGLRAGEAAGLTLADVDLRRGALRLDENKTDDPRAWALDPGVVGALRRWVELHRAGAEDGDPLFTDEHGRSLNGEQLAAPFRACLEKAGVTRAELFESSKARRPIRVHDLRASFVTVSLAEGRSEAWIADRTGHRSSVMINRYKRAARTVADLGLGPFRPLDQAIPELGAREPHFPAYSPETLETAENMVTPRRFELLLPA